MITIDDIMYRVSSCFYCEHLESCASGEDRKALCAVKFAKIAYDMILRGEY